MMRSPLGIALLFTILLVGWFVSRPLLQGAAGEPAPASTPVAAAEAPRMTVLVAVSTARSVAPELVITGRTEPVRSVRLRAETDGRVEATPAAEGALVAPGDVLARIDLRDRESRLREAEALVSQRTLEFEGARKLGEKRFQSETQVAQARTQLEVARTLRHEAELDLRHTELRAPFAGVLERRMVEAGDYVDAGDEVAMVIEQDPFLVVADAPESVVGRLRPGEVGTALLADGRSFSGRVRNVASQADPSTRTFRVELEIDNPGSRFPAGMSARVLLREPEQPAHRISAAALVLADDGQIGIKAVDDGGRVVFHPARIVRSETDAVWLGGLPERLAVIVTGGGFVAAGEAVNIEMTPETIAGAAS